MAYNNSKKRNQKTEETEVTVDTGKRLNKFLANAGICSRREADKLIEKGLVKVNNKVMKEMGYKVTRKDKVTYKGELLTDEKLVYILLNKPKDFITNTTDEKNRKTVMDLVNKACDERIFPIGRLDRTSTGLLLLTNDGELTNTLSHPSTKVRKLYQVTLDKPLEEEDYLKIKNTVVLEDGHAPVDDIAIGLDPTIVGVEISIVRNKVVNRIFESLGYKVERLDRSVYAGLTKKDLPRGKWRKLSDKDVMFLKRIKMRKTTKKNSEKK